MSESAQQRESGHGDPDVLLDIPRVSVDSIRLAVDGLDADLSLRARVANLIQVDAGVRVHLSGAELDIDGVHAEAQLRVRLEQLTMILGRALDTLDHNPQLIEALARTAVTALDDVNPGVPQPDPGATAVGARRPGGLLDGPGQQVRMGRPGSGPPVGSATPQAGGPGPSAGGPGSRAGGPASGEQVRPESGGTQGRHPAGRRHGERHHPEGQRPAGPGDRQQPAGPGGGQQPADPGDRQRPAGPGDGSRSAGPDGGQRSAGAARGTEGPAGSSTAQPRSQSDQSPAPRPSASGDGDGGSGPLGGAQAAAQSAAQFAEQAGETLRQAGRSVWEAIQSGMAQHRQQGRDG
ncbi:hypothetical protein [Micromonospora sp. NPDC048898]|uniref:hypothetical protein n=1 Tax=Micromonospora sp. NPDC048898 TaxID=3364260 RepID=UPI0037228F47